MVQLIVLFAVFIILSALMAITESAVGEIADEKEI